MERQTEHIQDRVVRDGFARVDRNVLEVAERPGFAKRYYGDPNDVFPGWIRITGERVKTALFPALFAAIGHRHRLATDTLTTTDFRLPAEIPNETWFIKV